MMGMDYVWGIVSKSKRSFVEKEKRFILAYTSLCILVTTILCAIIGIFIGFTQTWFMNSIIVVGYAGLIYGFFASVYYVYQI